MYVNSPGGSVTAGNSSSNLVCLCYLLQLNTNAFSFSVRNGYI
jgi:hypothetical protein